MATYDVIFDVLEVWPPEWHALAISTVKVGKFAAQRKKEEAKLWVAQLVEKRWKKAVAAKAQEVQDATKATAKAQKVAEKECKGWQSPSPQQEQEMETETEEVGTDLQTASTQLKRQHPRE